MDDALFNEVFSYLAEKSETWEPSGIFLSTSIGKLNIMDFIKGGSAGDEGYVYFSNEALPIDPSVSANRDSLLKSIKAACAEAGIEILCKGWENNRQRMVFTCKRGRKYDSRNRNMDSKRLCVTCKPLCDEDKCPFNFTIRWFPLRQSWGMNIGTGCRFHSGHFPKEKDEVKLSISDLPPEKLQNIKDCNASHISLGAVAAFAEKQTGVLLSKGQLYRLKLNDRQELVNTSEQIVENPVICESSPAQRLIQFLKSEPDISYVCLYGHEDSNLITIRKPSRAELQSCVLVNDGVAIPSVFGSDQQQEAKAHEYHNFKRGSMKVGKHMMLLCILIQSDEERRLTAINAEVLGVDVTEQTNKEKRPLLLMAHTLKP